MVIDIPSTYSLKVNLANYKQTNFLNPFRLNRSCWPVDRPLKVRVSKFLFTEGPLSPFLSLAP